MPEPSTPTPCGAFTHTPDDNPADILNNAAAVCRFLAEMAESFTPDRGAAGLSATAAFGLILILDGVENTINNAVARL